MERKALLNGIGVYGHDWIARNTDGRTRKAVSEKILREFGAGGGMCRGTYSLVQLAEETGYTRRQLQRAGKALAQRWARTARGGVYLITDDQLVQLVEWLATDYWCPKLRLYGCVECGTDQHSHLSRGLCRRCFYRTRRLVARLGLETCWVKLRARIEELRGTAEVEAGIFLARVARDLDDGKALVESDLHRLANSA